MLGSLGEKINHGGTADIHAWAPGQVVKLFKEGFPLWISQQEALMTQAGRGDALMSSRPKKAYYFVSNHLQVICSCHRHFA